MTLAERIEQKGIAKGIERGLAQGIEQGKLEGSWKEAGNCLQYAECRNGPSDGAADDRAFK